jgi:SAM-dependent methyltransferase
VIPSAPYDTIASVYDHYWGNEFAEFAQGAFQTHLSGVLPRGAAVLDLCCGTGLLMVHLESLGYRAFGVDESSGMLEAARRNALHAGLGPFGLQCADMASFEWNFSFDAVVCFYNSVNHTRSLEHLASAMANVARHLNPGGLFLFDYAAREAFERYWDSQEHIETEGGMAAMNYAYERTGGRATCRIDAQSTEIRQMALEPEQVHALLERVGFTVERETAMAGPNPVVGRRLVLARRELLRADGIGKMIAKGRL